MVIAVDTSMIDYALKYALISEDDSEVNFICNRIMEAVPQMQLATVLHAQQRINDYFQDNDPDYLKGAPLRRLLEVVNDKRKEFVE